MEVSITGKNPVFPIKISFDNGTHPQYLTEHAAIEIHKKLTILLKDMGLINK